MRNQHVHRPRTSFARMASRTLLAVAVGLPLAYAVDPTVPLVTLNVDTVRAQAFESDVTNYGEVKVSRTTSLLSPQTISLDLSGTATLTGDYTVQINPADQANATLGTPVLVAGSSPAAYTVALTFNANVASARIQVIAVPDAAQAIPELGETVSFSLPILPPGLVVNGSHQRGTITIVDANVQLATYIDQSPAHEIIPDTINGLAQDAAGRMRLWFTNSSAFSSVTPTTSYAPYASRFVEATNAGSSATVITDFIATYRIGGHQRCLDRIGAVIEPSVYLSPLAIRSTNEYGSHSYLSGGVFPGYTDGVFGQTIATPTSAPGLQSVTVDRITQISGARYLSITVNGVFTDLTAPGVSVSFADIIIGGVALTKISFNSFPAAVSAPIAQGSIVNLHYQTQSGTIITPGDLNPAVSMPVLYPLGARSLSIDQGVSGVSLRKGDVFVLDGSRYRITGTGDGIYSPTDAIFIDPGLQKALLRTSPLNLQTHFQAKFNISNRETFFIPALPSIPYFGYPTGNSDEVVDVAGTASDLPNGDWVDLMFSPIDDNEVEGEEDILVTLLATSANNGYDLINPAVARIPIGDNDVIVAAELSANAQIPTGNGSFTVELSQAFPTDLTVPFTVLQNAGSADAVYGTDYNIANTSADSAGRVTGAVIVPAGALRAVVSVIPNATSPILQDQSKVIRIALDDSLDYALAGSVSSSTNASTSTITITRTITPPIINSAATGSAKVGVAYLYAITTTGATPTSYTATNLPAGLTVDNLLGTISGTPTQSGIFVIPITATNGGGTSSITLILTVNPTAPVFSSPTTATVTVNSPFSYVTVANGQPISTYTATNLPVGLVINSATGVISGTPTAVGINSVIIKAANAGGVGQMTLVITVNSAAPIISSSTSATATVGSAFTYSIVANGATSYNATGLPPGLVVSTVTGLISGTPTTVGVTPVTLTAVNAGGTGTVVLNLTVNPPGSGTSGATTGSSSAGGGGGACGAGSGLAAILGGLSLLMLRLTSKRR